MLEIITLSHISPTRLVQESIIRLRITSCHRHLLRCMCVSYLIHFAKVTAKITSHIHIIYMCIYHVIIIEEKKSCKE